MNVIAGETKLVSEHCEMMRSPIIVTCNAKVFYVSYGKAIINAEGYRQQQDP